MNIISKENIADDRGGAGVKKTAIREFDAARYLNSEEAIAEYLAACLEVFSLDAFLLALGDVAKARGIRNGYINDSASSENISATRKPG